MMTTPHGIFLMASFSLPAPTSDRNAAPVSAAMPTCISNSTTTSTSMAQHAERQPVDPLERFGLDQLGVAAGAGLIALRQFAGAAGFRVNSFSPPNRK